MRLKIHFFQKGNNMAKVFLNLKELAKREREEKDEVRGEVLRYFKNNKGVTKAKARADLRAIGKAKGFDPERLERWLALLEKLLPLFLMFIK